MAASDVEPNKVVRRLTDDYIAAGRHQNTPGFKTVAVTDVSERGFSGSALVVATIPEDAELRSHAKQFKAALVAYQKSVDEDPKQILATSFKSGYQQVLATLADADKKYHKNKKDCLNTLEKCCQNFQRYEKSFESWMQLLPTESWQGSLICGGLKVLFGAIARVHTVRLDIGRVLEHIPITMANAEKYLDMYTDRLVHQKCVKELFISIVELLQICVEFFAKKWYSKVSASVFKGAQYGQDLQDKFARFKQADEWVTKGTTLMLHENVRDVSQKIDDMRKDLTTGAILLQDMRDLFLGVEKARVDELEARIQMEMRFKYERINEHSVRLLREQLEYDLDFDYSQCLRDQKRCLTMIPNNYPEARQRMLWIVGCKEIEAWLDSRCCEFLLVNGHEPSHGRAESAVSMFSAAVLHSIQRKSPDTITVFWFGGQNSAAEPEDMVAGLLAQLLNQGTAAPEPAVMNSIAGQALNDVDSLIDVLDTWLRVQLTKASIVLVVDSVSCYEDEARRDGIVSLYEMLFDLIEEASTTFPLKVLFTSPTKSRTIGVYDDERESRVLNVPILVH